MTYMPQNFVVWAEIRVRDLDHSIAFYEAVTKGRLRKETMGPQEIAIFETPMDGPHVSANLVVGEPAAEGAGNIVHFGGQGTAEEMRARVLEAGGTIAQDIFEIPPGRVFLAHDPDGNTVGFFEPKA